MWMLDHRLEADTLWSRLCSLNSCHQHTQLRFGKQFCLLQYLLFSLPRTHTHTQLQTHTQAHRHTYKHTDTHKHTFIFCPFLCLSISRSLSSLLITHSLSHTLSQSPPHTKTHSSVGNRCCIEVINSKSQPSAQALLCVFGGVFTTELFKVA